eukprot:COSAG05_NODE_4398_length_1530_cov_13.213138_2_plen_30_part_00
MGLVEVSQPRRAEEAPSESEVARWPELAA